MSTHATVAVRCGNALGEGLVWCERAQALYWTDIQAATLWRHRPADGDMRSWPMPERLACFALCESDDTLLLGLASGLAFFHLASAAITPLMPVEEGLPTRLNDGACDRQGRFVFGTLHEPASGGAQRPIGAFYRLNADLTLEKLSALGPVAISNSLAFSPDGGTIYFCDSPSRTIRCAAYGERIGAPRDLLSLDGSDGVPDGSCIDADGGLWNAQWGRGRIVRYTPHGQLDRIVRVDASQPTRPAFGGAGLATLYVTSARDGLSAAALAGEAHAGDLFAAKPGVRGLAEPRFAGMPPS